MLRVLLLTGQAQAFEAVAAVVLGGLGLLFLLSMLVMFGDRLGARDLLAILLTAVLLVLAGGAFRAEDLKFYRARYGGGTWGSDFARGAFGLGVPLGTVGCAILVGVLSRGRRGPDGR